jgi:hypothetical protein
MKRLTLVLLIACTALASHAQVPCKWEAEASEASPAQFSCYRGETLAFHPTFLEYGVTVSNATYTLLWQTNGMGTAYWTNHVLQFTPAMDVDTLLISIRIASYGHDMDFGSKCPKCGHECEHTVDLRSILDRMRTPDYNTSLKSGDLEIFFRPMTYKNLNDNNAMQYENQKLLQLLPDSEVADTEKMTALGAALKRITEITVRALSQSIAVIKTPQALVSEAEYIEELLNNCDRDLFGRIRDHIVELKSQAEMPPMSLICPECKNEYEQAVTLDMSSFFAPAS